MNLTAQTIQNLLPEIVLSLTVLVLFCQTLGTPREAILRWTAFAGAILTCAAAVATFDTQALLFFQAYKVDLLAQLFKAAVSGGLALVVMAGPGLTGIDRRLHGEYHLFLAISTLGLVFLASSVELISIILSLEIASCALYVLIPFRSRGATRSQAEAAIKYVLFGAVATGVTLYGMSYLFGLTGTTYLADLVSLVPQRIGEPLMVVALILTMAGFLYKSALFPLHFMTPDAYQGSANETASFLATIPKVGVVAILVRIMATTGSDLSNLSWLLAALAVLSMTAGNLTALVQDDIKRLLAYSSIAHAGYLAIGLLSASELGLGGAIYYALGYLVMNLACFFVLYHLAPTGENVSFENLNGLARRSPLLAFTLAAGAFGLTGIPPTVGFAGKFVLFTAAFERGLTWLVIVALINAAISAFYYLRMVRAAYVEVPVSAMPIPLSIASRLLGLFLITATLAVGAFPQPFVALAKEAVRALH